MNTAPRTARRRALRAGLVVTLAAAAVVAACSSGAEPPTRRRPTTTTTTAAPVEPAAPAGVVAPLTGVLLPPEEAGRLARPAVAVKVDNAPEAAPQFGLSAADMVVEVQVEGISRFIAVFHSRDVETVGPVRSGRTSDPDLLAAFGRPLVAWSGGNDNVVRVMRNTDWVQNVSHDDLPGAYRRERSRRAPHNLLVDLPRIREAAQEPVVAPTPRFAYRDPAAPLPGRPVAGMSVPVGKSPSTYLWDAAGGNWLRWSAGARHVDDSGAQIAPTNVVVLGTRYVPSSADRRSPEAQTVGGGPAWVYTGGHEIAGAWFRPDRAAPWSLVDAAGNPIELAPGSTWVELPDESVGPSEVDAATAQALSTGP